jgi:hypothetical protein
VCAEPRWRAGGGANGANGADVDDLIHLRGPLTEDAVVRALQARFYHNKYYVCTSHTIHSLIIDLTFDEDYNIAVTGSPLVMSAVFLVVFGKVRQF